MKRLSRIISKVRGSMKKSPSAEFLAEALSELERSQGDKLTWATALNEANGDEEYAKTIYMRQRGRVLADRHRQAVEANQRAAHKRQVDALRTKLAQDNQIMAKFAEDMTPEQREFADQYPVGKHFQVLFLRYGYRVVRMSSETASQYATRLQRFARDLERETGVTLE